MMNRRQVINGSRLRLTPAGSAAKSPSRPIAPDCRHYRGDKPCLHNRLCGGCQQYSPYQSRLCIIKLGALGDVIRTLCILPELRRQHPDAHVTWVSLPNGCRMIQGHPQIDRILEFDSVSQLVLAQETFDVVICLDKEPQPCALASAMFARRKMGVGLSAFGTPMPMNAEAEPYFHLGLSDNLKFRENRKSYPQLAHEALGLEYRRQRYELPVNEMLRDRHRLRMISRGWKPGEPTLGVNVGAGRAFANKMWPVERIVATLAAMRKTKPQTQILLLGGPDERLLIEQITTALREARLSEGVFDGGVEHDEPSFVALVDVCDVVFTGDTMAMHVAIALGKHVVAVFGPTCEQEIDLFDRGQKLIASVPCSPCYKKTCDGGDKCVLAIEPSTAATAVVWMLEQAWRERMTQRPAAFRRAG